MGNFRQGGRGGFEGRDRSSGGRFGGRSGFRERGSGDFGRPEMHDAVCSKCGKQCQVPFRPTGSKPVFCSECFGQNGGGSRNNSGGGDNSEQMNKINVKLDKILAILAELEIMPEEGSEDEIIVDSEDDEEESEDDSEDE